MIFWFSATPHKDMRLCVGAFMEHPVALRLCLVILVWIRWRIMISWDLLDGFQLLGWGLSWELSIGGKAEYYASFLFLGLRTISETGFSKINKQTTNKKHSIIKGKILRKRPSYGESPGLTLWSSQACPKATWYSDCFSQWGIQGQFFLVLDCTNTSQEVHSSLFPAPPGSASSALLLRRQPKKKPHPGTLTSSTYGEVPAL